MPLEGEGEAVLSRDITRVGLAEGRCQVCQWGREGLSLAEAETLWRGLLGKCGKGQECGGGQLQEALQSWAGKLGLQLVDGLRDADHLLAKSWSDSSVVWG